MLLLWLLLPPFPDEFPPEGTDLLESSTSRAIAAPAAKAFEPLLRGGWSPCPIMGGCWADINPGGP
eukprot:CAMPEP_0206627878 /NCGR_PEP_ID=MMETSP0325_2-20121206/66213_1 /ASSEMBLY_ACC=CAM_ASM_000347 /TAXON_ID=2866 /ORGANISM="Crypthecodinium cohnii, Strain Seligo" /LENGTH=65 /DNA_ID=CAMNT_0054152577 /DNA_START=824 /DNA_END=1021 /DNA_ORIENTATION=+